MPPPSPFKPESLTFQAARFNAETALQALRQSGCILIRSLFNPTLINSYLRRAERVFALRQAEYAAGTLPVGYHKNYDYGRMTYLSLRELDLPNEVPFRFVELLAKSLLIPFLNRYYGSTVWWNQLESNLRLQVPDQPELLIPFHQDGPFQANPAYPQLNCWLPLVAAGQDTPGLEVAPMGLNTLWPVIPAEAEAESPLYASYALNQAKVLEAIGGPDRLWHPQIWPGDVLILDSHLLHRSYVTPEMTKPRYSVEFRTLPANDLPAAQRKHYGMMALG